MVDQNGNTAAPDRQISLKIYESDHAWLKRRQRKVSDRADEWLLLPDVIHQLIQAQIVMDMDGIVMVPLIENPEAFMQRTMELRTQGNNLEADRRDAFTRKQWNGEG
jgi:hypothetical protein